MSRTARFDSLLSVCVSATMRERLEQEAAQRESTPSQLVRQALSEHFAAQSG